MSERENTEIYGWPAHGDNRRAESHGPTGEIEQVCGTCGAALEGNGSMHSCAAEIVALRNRAESAEARLVACRREYDELWESERSRDKPVADLARERESAEARCEALEALLDRVAQTVDDETEAMIRAALARVEDADQLERKPR